MSHASVSAGSLDMLLDTKCNTFGGVCFIALLVAILSAMLPKTPSTEPEPEPDVQKLVEDERLSQLMRQRDELKAAVALQQDLLSSISTNETVVTVQEADLVAQLSEKDDAVEKLKAQLRGLEEEIAQLSTSTEYNKAEAERLRKLSEELKKELSNVEFKRRRTVRTPLERELAGWSPVDVWIKYGKLYVKSNTSQVSMREVGTGGDKEWHYTVKPGTGYTMDKRFFQGSSYISFLRDVYGSRYVRIFVDSSSFSELCQLRDDLVERRLHYNWHLCDDEELVFVFGNDEKVQ